MDQSSSTISLGQPACQTITKALDDHEFFYLFTIMIWAQKCDQIIFQSHLKKVSTISVKNIK